MQIEKKRRACNIYILNLLEVVIHSALDSVGLKPKVNVATVPEVDVVLVEYIIQALVQVLQVEQDDSSPCLHTNFDLVNVATHLKKMELVF